MNDKFEILNYQGEEVRVVKDEQGESTGMILLCALHVRDCHMKHCIFLRLPCLSLQEGKRIQCHLLIGNFHFEIGVRITN